MIRVVFPEKRWMMRGNAAPLLYRMVCTTCAARSVAQRMSQPGQDWALAHAERYPRHRDFSEQVTRGWTVGSE